MHLEMNAISVQLVKIQLMDSIVKLALRVISNRRSRIKLASLVRKVLLRVVALVFHASLDFSSTRTYNVNEMTPFLPRNKVRLQPYLL